MLNEFKHVIEFIDKTFPNVDSGVKDKAKMAIEQFEQHHSMVGYLTTRILDKVSQGDIISEIPFFYFEDDGTQKQFKAKGVILSVSCDIDNDNYVLIVPLMKLSDYRGSKDKIIYNNTLTYLYFPDTCVKDYYIDFSFICSYSKEMIMESIKKSKVKRIASLSLVGYYMFITKLSAFIARREDNETRQNRIEKS